MMTEQLNWIAQNEIKRHNRRLRNWSLIFGKQIKHLIADLENPLVLTTGMVTFTKNGVVTEVTFSSKVSYKVDDQSFTSIKAATAHLSSLM